ncbi:DUF1761 family protein [Halocynthiibacter sp. C4]|uniref:DUF1761 family protein n=1 Tax=Halocynthiibacter sp. C4 TaxID=2992758 RepID=UPI00237A28EB|nr:DUF1761 family protein [Halocynthiibacter sp. C4]MDE0589907.1 DUF1761 family protein [Halocynthiibacter sp. C4]
MENEAMAINWLAVFAGTIVAFIFGAIWYHPKVMGTKWAAGSGIDMSKISGTPVFAMAAQTLALFLLALVVGITATTDALFTAIFAILAVGVHVVSAGAFLQKSGAALAIDFGYLFLSGAIMIVAQGIF